MNVSLFRLTVTHLRILILGVNFLLMGLVGHETLYRVFNEYAAVGDVRAIMKADPETFRFKEGKRRVPSSVLPQIASKGEPFLDPPEIPESPVPQEGEPGKEDVVETGEEQPRGALEPGPLDEEWEYDGGIYIGDNSEWNYAVLVKKDKTPTTKGLLPRRSNFAKQLPSRTRTLRARGNRNSLKRRTVAAKSKQLKTLRVFDRWVVDEGKAPAPRVTRIGRLAKKAKEEEEEEDRLVIWVDRITPEEFVYEVEGEWVLYALRAKKREFIFEGPGGDGVVVGSPKDEEDEEDEEGAESTGEEKKSIITVGGPLETQKEIFERRKEPNVSGETESEGAEDSVGTSGKPGPPSRRFSPGSSSRGSGPKSEKEQLRELGNTLKEIKAGDLTPKQRTELKKLDKVLRGKKR